LRSRFADAGTNYAWRTAGNTLDPSVLFHMQMMTFESCVVSCRRRKIALSDGLGCFCVQIRRQTTDRGFLMAELLIFSSCFPASLILSSSSTSSHREHNYAICIMEAAKGWNPGTGDMKRSNQRGINNVEMLHESSFCCFYFNFFLCVVLRCDEH